jgi:hypothetical protein
MLKDGTDFIGLGEVDHSDLGNADYMKKGYEAILAHKQLEKSIF